MTTSYEGDSKRGLLELLKLTGIVGLETQDQVAIWPDDDRVSSHGDVREIFLLNP